MSRASRRRRYRARSGALLRTIRAGGYPTLRHRDLTRLIAALRPFGYVQTQPDPVDDEVEIF